MTSDNEDDELENCWWCGKKNVNEDNAIGLVDEGDYTAFICPKCADIPEVKEHLY
tara:strand:- start:110 stop:274 length:165 start_codon:yes stop_codon:yes gene_type:complete